MWIESLGKSLYISGTRRSKYHDDDYLKTIEVLTDATDYQLHDVNECRKRKSCVNLSVSFLFCIEWCISIFSLSCIFLSSTSRIMIESSLKFEFTYRNNISIMISTFLAFENALWSIRRFLCRFLFGSRSVYYLLSSYLSVLKNDLLLWGFNIVDSINDTKMTAIP